MARMIQKELGELFIVEGKKLTASKGMITVTQVRITPDMGLARVYLSIFNVADKQALIADINKEAYVYRKMLGQRIRHQVRKIPDLRFFVDDTLDRAAEIESLFEEIRNSDATTRPSDDNVND